MKHSYRAECECSRCTKERTRRDKQGMGRAISNATRLGKVAKQMARSRTQTRRPIVGSQEWAETRGDDLGESPDY